MGAFLRSDPSANPAESEKAWEKFAAMFRDQLANNATTLFSYIIILAAAIAIITMHEEAKSLGFYIGYFSWLFTSCIFNFLLWRSHRKTVKQLDGYRPEEE